MSDTINPNMETQQILLQFGEMTASELRLAKAIVAWHERELASVTAERDELKAKWDDLSIDCLSRLIEIERSRCYVKERP